MSGSRKFDRQSFVKLFSRLPLSTMLRCAAVAMMIAATTSEPMATLAKQVDAGSQSWSYIQYVTRVDWSMNKEDSVTYTSSKLTDIANNTKVTSNLGGYPPYYLFSSGEEASNPPLLGSLSWQYPQYIYNQGFNMSRLNLCKVGSWQDWAVKYENGPEFLKLHPKGSWTQCQVGAMGGLGGGTRWYLYFANVTMKMSTFELQV